MASESSNLHYASDQHHLSAHAAMQIAWGAWLSMLVLPFLFFIYVLWTLMGQSTADVVTPRTSETWFLGSMLYLVALVPLSFFARSRLFKSYWEGRPVAPKNYLAGMMLMWITLEIGGLLSLAGCLVDHKLAPNMIPALVAFGFFATLWPSGRAMFKTDGDKEDPQLYEEPR
jgi:hypothetical protein